MIRAASGQTVGAQMINASTGAAFTGTVTVYVTLDAGLQTIGSVGSGICTHEGNGFHSYRPAASETDAALAAFTFIGSGAIPATIQYPTISEAQQSALIASSVSGAIAVATLCDDAARELNLIMGGESLSGNDGATVLGRLNLLLDMWNADRATVFAVDFTDFTLTPNLSPHTIGPSGATWTVTQRPVAIDGAALILTSGSTPVFVPINVRNMDWWNNQRVPGMTSSIPTDVAYNPTWPNGELHFWPVPDTAYEVQLYTRGLFSQVTLAGVVTLPPGYRAALTYTLVEMIAVPFGRTVPPETARLARKARAAVMVNNDVVPPYRTDGGPTRGEGRNWMTGWYS